MGFKEVPLIGGLAGNPEAVNLLRIASYDQLTVPFKDHGESCFTIID